MNQVYKKEQFIVFPVEDAFVVCNTDKVFKVGHTRVKKMDIARLIINLTLENKLPKNPHLVDNIIRIADDKCYIEKLKEFKENNITEKDINNFMKHDSYSRKGGALVQKTWSK